MREAGGGHPEHPVESTPLAGQTTLRVVAARLGWFDQSAAMAIARSSSSTATPIWPSS